MEGGGLPRRTAVRQPRESGGRKAARRELAGDVDWVQGTRTMRRASAEMNALPDFRLPRVDGEGSSTLAEVLEDRRAVVVVFWSAVCSHCRRYDDFLRRFAVRRPQLGLLLVGCRRGETSQDLQAALERRSLGATLVHDETGEVTRAWGVRQTPTAFLLDSDRRPIYHGAIDDFTYPDAPGHRAYLEEAITALAAGGTPPVDHVAAFGCPVESVYYRLPSVVGRSEDG